MNSVWNKVSHWLCACFLALLATMSGTVLDHLSRAILSYVKIASFDVYISPKIYYAFIPMALLVGSISTWLCVRNGFPSIVGKTSIILTVFAVAGFATLLLFATGE